MNANHAWALGVDIGGTKIEVAAVDNGGNLGHRLVGPTESERGAAAVRAKIISAVEEISRSAASPPAGIGVGMAGQIEARTGMVRFAPNLGWRDEPLQDDLQRALGFPVVVTNDVRAATWGEWLHGAGRGCSDLVCLFVGTGVGGGIVSAGEIISGCSNTAGELGHIIVQMNGPLCTCGNRGCLEALAGGWAIARRAREAIADDPAAGRSLLNAAGGRVEDVTAAHVQQAAGEGDLLSAKILEEAGEALVAGAVSIIHAFNPCRLILGGGVVEGRPRFIDHVREGVLRLALRAARQSFEVVPASLGKDAGVIGAASLILHSLKKPSQRTQRAQS